MDAARRGELFVYFYLFAARFIQLLRALSIICALSGQFILFGRELSSIVIQK